jgi:molybdate transport system substrate-binding protein
MTHGESGECLGAQDAGRVTVLSTIAIQLALQHLLPTFCAPEDIHVDVEFGIVAEFLRRIDAQAPFDVAFFSAAATEQLVRSGKMMPGSAVEIASSSLALAVAPGAAPPDISTIDAFVKALRETKSIILPKEGISGVLFVEILAELGLLAELEAKLVFDVSGGFVGHAVAKGEIETAVQLFSELLAVPGLQVLGPLPPMLQHRVVVSGGVSSASTHAAWATAFLQYLASASHESIFREAGMELLRRGKAHE